MLCDVVITQPKSTTILYCVLCTCTKVTLLTAKESGLSFNKYFWTLGCIKLIHFLLLLCRYRCSFVIMTHSGLDILLEFFLLLPFLKFLFYGHLLVVLFMPSLCFLCMYHCSRHKFTLPHRLRVQISVVLCAA